MKQSLFKKTTVLLGAASIAAAGILIPAAAQASGNIDPSKDGQASLTIHKYKADSNQSGQGQPNPGGTLIADTSNLGQPLQGVEFTVTPVTQKNGKAINLAEPAGWDLIKGLNSLNQSAQVAAVKGGDYTLGTPEKKSTGSNGEVKFSGKAFGLYLVEETNPGNNNITAPAAPILVTLPLTSGTGWNYDVHMYPKNTVGDDISKTVKSIENNEITWLVNSPVPALAAGQPGYTKAIITDNLDSRLTYKDGSAKVSFRANGSNSATALDAADFTASVSGQTLTVSLNPSGLAKLAAGSLQVEFATTVVGNGAISNTVISNINDSTFEVADNQPNTPVAYYGYLKINKKSNDQPALPLQNAKFGIYASQSDAENGTAPIATVTTKADGTVSQQLALGKKDVSGNIGSDTKTFFVKELEAPAGYVLDSTVRSVVVNKDHSAAVPVELDITNEKALVPGLPLTGGQGATLLAVAGGALVIAGASVAVLRRRNKQVTA